MGYGLAVMGAAQMSATSCSMLQAELAGHKKSTRLGVLC